MPPPPDPPEVAATIGSFDGVHLGHRALLDVVSRRAAERGLAPAVITFDPHPRRVLRPAAPLKLISPHRPGLIQSGDDGGFIYLVMPVRLNV